MPTDTTTTPPLLAALFRHTAGCELCDWLSYWDGLVTPANLIAMLDGAAARIRREAHQRTLEERKREAAR